MMTQFTYHRKQFSNQLVNGAKRFLRVPTQDDPSTWNWFQANRLRSIGLFVIPAMIPFLISCDVKSAGGLLAAAGVLSAVLIQILAWVSTRIGAIADMDADRQQHVGEVMRTERLKNLQLDVIYSAVVSLILVALLGGAELFVSQANTIIRLASAFFAHLLVALYITITHVSRVSQLDAQEIRSLQASQDDRASSTE